MNEVTTQNIAIIGSGPAGWTAAIYAARAALEPILFEGALTPENQDAGRLPMGQLATTTYVENYPGFPAGDLREYLKTTIDEERQYALPYDTFDEAASKRGVSGPALVELMRKQALDCGVRVVSEDVAKVDFSKRPFKLVDSNGDEYFARSVIVATGASARWLGLTTEEFFKNNGVSACAVCDGALPRFYKRPILVVGGGDSAAEDALYLTKFASKVYLAHRRDQLRASNVMQKRLRENPKVELLWNRVPTEILGSPEKGVERVKLANVLDLDETPLEIEASGVFVAIGRRPNTEFLEGALKLDANGFILHESASATATSVPGVFAAGDCADSRYRQAIVAAGSGACAALDAERFLMENE